VVRTGWCLYDTVPFYSATFLSFGSLFSCVTCTPLKFYIVGCACLQRLYLHGLAGTSCIAVTFARVIIIANDLLSDIVSHVISVCRRTLASSSSLIDVGWILAFITGSDEDGFGPCHRPICLRAPKQNMWLIPYPLWL
jgi:hypothetical protein